MSSGRAQLVYTGLKPGEIRLLYPDIQAGREDLWLLKVAQLKDEHGKRTLLAFDALSYTWGQDHVTTFPVICNDQELRVQHNLNHALPFLPIWIDAVCINQPDNDEKMEQLKMMRQINEYAPEVWAWLGPSDEYSEMAIAMLPHPTNPVKDKRKSWGEHFTKEPEVIPWLSSEKAWSAYNNIVQNEWYNCLWVYQEVAFAKKLRVMLGSHEIDWDTLSHVLQHDLASNFVGADGQTPKKNNRRSKNIILVRQERHKSLASGTLTARTFARILRYATTAECRVDKDRILALLGFINLQIPAEASTEDLYILLCRSVLLSLDPKSSEWWALLLSATSANKRQGLPNWERSIASTVITMSTTSENEEPHLGTKKDNSRIAIFNLDIPTGFNSTTIKDINSNN
ncbi:heterokaryon incompatibility protein-domain-containing protein [Stachybotrys elegans]|uniref:Heterokaryon incompatibility protein-domain-containing protein n=1 Tax=Stachybotrys elegans TaxID=80388 RepID=A0A8K0SGF9_9HYPO|nr:heterokaryon incompatibility protein-domain-containing protein [Stachybotrys elegans]